MDTIDFWEIDPSRDSNKIHGFYNFNKLFNASSTMNVLNTGYIY